MCRMIHTFFLFPLFGSSYRTASTHSLTNSASRHHSRSHNYFHAFSLFYLPYIFFQPFFLNLTSSIAGETTLAHNAILSLSLSFVRVFHFFPTRSPHFRPSSAGHPFRCMQNHTLSQALPLHSLHFPVVSAPA